MPNTPQRQCLGCREKKTKKELIRVVRSPEGVVSLDKNGKMPGRGAYICPQVECLRRVVKTRALTRQLDTEIPPDLLTLLEKQLEVRSDGG